MKREFRLKKSDDFKRVRRNGKSYAHPLVVLVALPNETGRLQIGVTASRSLGGAVQRNRARRLLREALRPRLSEIKPGWDLILIARQPLLAASFQALQASLEVLLHRGQLYREHASEDV